MPRDVGLLMLARVLMSASRALASVIVPIYLTEIGFSATELGVLFAFTAITTAVLSSVVGVFADRFGRKPFLIGVPIVTALAGLGFGFLHSVVAIFACATLGSLGRGAGAEGGTAGPYQPAEQAFIADATPSPHRNRAFVRLELATVVGAFLGSQLAWIPDLAARLGAQGAAADRPAFVAFSLCALLTALCAMSVIDQPRAKRSVAKHFTGPRKSTPFLLRLWATNSVDGLAGGFFGPFLTYWFYQRYGVSTGTIGLLYAIVNGTSLLSVLGAAPLARRAGLVRAIVFSRILMATLVGLLALAPTFWIAGAFYILRMIASRLANPLRQSYVMAVVPPEERGSIAALSQLPSQGTGALSQVLAGFLFEHLSLALPFFGGAVLQVLNGVLFFGLFHDLRPPEEKGSTVG